MSVYDIIFNSCNRVKYNALSIIVAILCSGMLSSTFLNNGTTDNTFYLYPLCLSIIAISIMTILLSIIKENHFHISHIDILLIFTVVYYIIRYDFTLQLANWKVFYVLLLLFEWFVMRIILSCWTISKQFIYIGISAIGGMLAIWGLLQLYGISESNHIYFSITGPFYNPGPYSGYIAVIMPITLFQLLKTKGGVYYFLLLFFSLMLVILPAGMSRSAWLGCLLGVCLVLALHYHWWQKTVDYLKRDRKKSFVYIFMLFIILGIGAYFVFQIKAESAYGRLFIWKNCCRAILQQPLQGYGPGSFQHIYGEMQTKYFMTSNYTHLEEQVAGAPEYAFNEYIQASMEGGIILLLLSLGLFICGICKGVKNKEYTACTGLLSLFVFSLSSYPFQILAFGTLGILLLAICITKDNGIVKENKYLSFQLFIVNVVVLFGSLIISCPLRKYENLITKWNKFVVSEVNVSIDSLSVRYEKDYIDMQHNIHFLLAYVKVLTEQKSYDKVSLVLDRARLVCCDASIWNTKGWNYQLEGKYLEAEYCYKMSAYLLPSRLYPYYLLAKLYTVPCYFHQKEAERMAQIVLSKPPKIPSEVVNLMRKEMNNLLIELKNLHP